MPMPPQPDYASMPDPATRYAAFVKWHNAVCNYGEELIESLPDTASPYALDVNRLARAIEAMGTAPATAMGYAQRIAGEYNRGLLADKQVVSDTRTIMCRTSCGCDGRRPAYECGNSRAGSCSRCRD